MMLDVPAHETSDSRTSRDSRTATLKPRLHDTTGCQTRCQTGCQTGLTTGCIVYTHIQPVVTGLTTGWMFVYTIQPVCCCQTGCVTGSTTG